MTPKATNASMAMLLAIVVGCAHRAAAPPAGSAGLEETVRVLELYPGVTATIVAPSQRDDRRPAELIIYALPNGNTTAHTIGRRKSDGLDWRYDVQHIGAQTRAIRSRWIPQAVVAYLEADTRSWPAWRQQRGYDRANALIVEFIDRIRHETGNKRDLRVTLTGHSGGGSFMFGFIEGQDALPLWLHRIAFLDANYNFDTRHGEKLVAWLRRDPSNRLVVVAYDDRNVTLDGKRVVSDSGGTWRASSRMMNYLREPHRFSVDTVLPFVRYRGRQIEVLLHPNPENRILHTAMIGEMNGYMHAVLAGRPEYSRGEPVLKPARAYSEWVRDSIPLPPPVPPTIPRRPDRAMTGSAFIRSIVDLSREEREAAIRRELFAGNIPSFLRTLRTVEASVTGKDGVRRTISYQVMPDYLAIGSDDDFVRMPMMPYTGQAFADAFGFVLPTRKMVNDIWAAAEVHIEPRPLTQERESPLTFLQHHRIIEEQLRDSKPGAFAAGIKKDVVVTNRLLERPGRVAIFGWHYKNGQPIQPLYPGHVDWYVDYSHGIRPVLRRMRVDGVEMTFEAILKEPAYRDLVSDEGEITAWRYDR